jgi:Replication protein C N-terminal domain
VHTVDWLFRFTQPQDWERGGRPVVWPSASMQQEALGLSPTQVKEINRRLIELGLVTMKDSPNGKRYGRRDPKGRITEAYGFDLAPIATRHAEFRRLAEEGRAERAAMGRLRRRATIARKAIIQILETAAEYAIEGEEWITLARESEALARALRVVERADLTVPHIDVARHLDKRRLGCGHDAERIADRAPIPDHHPEEKIGRARLIALEDRLGQLVKGFILANFTSVQQHRGAFLHSGR